MEQTIKLHDYNYYIIGFSGGKDSIATFLYLLSQGIPKEKIELWHHLVDGESDNHFMDWPVTEDYCKKFAVAFDVPIYFSWKIGGFKKEMLKNNEPSTQSQFEYPTDEGHVECGLAGQNKVGTRMKFPQVSADLRTRWCSGYLKIDVADKALCNQERFRGKRTLVLTGERAEESASRAKYAVFEPHRADLRNGKRYQRHIDHYRPVHQWTEQEVWDIMEEYKVNPHPAYKMGWGRLSCMKCIFGSHNQWKSAFHIDKTGVQEIIKYEKQFQVTIHRTMSVTERLEKGSVYKNITPELAKASQNRIFEEEIILNQWELPSGAFGESHGPI